MRLRVHSNINTVTVDQCALLLSAISAAGSCCLEGGIPVSAAQVHSACLRIPREHVNFLHHTTQLVEVTNIHAHLLYVHIRLHIHTGRSIYPVQ